VPRAAEPEGGQLLDEVVPLAPAAARVARAGRLLAADSERYRLLKIQGLESEVSSALSEIACLDDALEGLQVEIESHARRKELQLTLASLGVGLAASVAAGVVDLTAPESSASPIVSISGGVVAAGLGAAALAYPTPTVELEHERNVLGDIWSGGKGKTLSPFVWRMLQSPREDGSTPREQLRTRFSEVLEATEPGAERRASLQALLFGTGGVYGAETLRLREVLLEQVEAEVALMDQDLAMLLRALETHDRHPGTP
jgi:hypothetical protein